MILTACGSAVDAADAVDADDAVEVDARSAFCEDACACCVWVVSRSARSARVSMRFEVCLSSAIAVAAKSLRSRSTALRFRDIDVGSQNGLLL
jgi:hypothetical protein